MRQLSCLAAAAFLAVGLLGCKTHGSKSPQTSHAVVAPAVTSTNSVAATNAVPPAVNSHADLTPNAPAVSTNQPPPGTNQPIAVIKPKPAKLIGPTLPPFQAVPLIPCDLELDGIKLVEMPVP